jgi:membrane fusion protein (multidrug efflux system)
MINAARVTAVPEFFASQPSSRWRLVAIALLGVAVVLVLPGCNRANETGAAKAPAAAAPQAVPVHTVQVEPRSVPIQFEVVGQLEGSKEVEVRARVGGILQKQDYHEGDPVRAGQLMFDIDPSTYEIAVAQARAQLAQENARLAQAKRDEARLKPLAADRAVSQREYDDALATLQGSQAQVQQAQANLCQAELNLSYTKVKAPVAGVSGRAQHSIGTLITTDANGSLLTTISQLTPVWARFSLAPTDLARIPGGRVNRHTPVQVEIVLPDGSIYPQKGRLNFAATAIDPNLGTQQLRAEFDNPRESLLPGQFVRVRITAGERENVFLVPQNAVLQTENANLVFVVGPDGKAAARPVKPGDWFGKDWAILSGLNAGDRVIIDNLLKIRPGVPVTEAPANPPAAGGAPGSASSGGSVSAGSGAAPKASAGAATPAGPAR